MEFKHAEHDAPVEMSFDEFVTRVRSGKVAPSAWYRTPWSRGWRTVDNYPPFHRHSPVKYPIGRLLEEDHQKAEQKSERTKAWYTRRDECRELMEQSYALRELQAIAGDPGVAGAARLRILPAFGPERVVTLTFATQSIHIDVIGSRHPLWWYMPDENTTRSFTPDHLVRGAGSVPYKRAPSVCHSWEAFAALVSPLGDCQSDTLDGVGYGHSASVAGRLVEAVWSNPRQPDHSGQVAVVSAYLALAKSARLSALLKVSYD